MRLISTTAKSISKKVIATKSVRKRPVHPLPKHFLSVVGLALGHRDGTEDRSASSRESSGFVSRTTCSTRPDIYNAIWSYICQAHLTASPIYAACSCPHLLFPGRLVE